MLFVVAVCMSCSKVCLFFVFSFIRSYSKRKGILNFHVMNISFRSDGIAANDIFFYNSSLVLMVGYGVCQYHLRSITTFPAQLPSSDWHITY